MPKDFRKDLDMYGVTRRDFTIASAAAVGTSAALALGTSPASAQGGATPPAAIPAQTTYTGDVIDGKRVITALDVNDLEPGRKHLLYFRGVATPTGQHWHVSVTVARGARPGKRVVLVSGVHGDEMSSVHAVQTVMNQLDPAAMSGTVWRSGTCPARRWRACSVVGPVQAEASIWST